MTVKVLELVKKTTTCGHCASKLEYEYSDTTEQTFSDYGGGIDVYRVITCPVCHCLVKLK